MLRWINQIQSYKHSWMAPLSWMALSPDPPALDTWEGSGVLVSSSAPHVADETVSTDDPGNVNRSSQISKPTPKQKHTTITTKPHPISYIVLLWWLFTLIFHHHLIISFCIIVFLVSIYNYSIIICIFLNLLTICVLLIYIYLIIHNSSDGCNVHVIPYIIYHLQVHFKKIIFHLSQLI